MNLRAALLESGSPQVASARLAGTCDRDDLETVADLAAACADTGAAHVLLDLSDLGGIRGEVVDLLAGWRREVVDAGGRFVVSDPNIVVLWCLRRGIGEGLEEAASYDRALAELRGEAPADEAPAAEGDSSGSAPASAPTAAGPARRLSVVLRAVLDDAPEPASWQAPLASLLTRSGLAAAGRLCLRRGDGLAAVDDAECATPLDGWLGSTLATAEGLLATAEIGERGLGLEERAFLRRLDADLLLPLGDGERLLGLLALRAGRSGGLSAYRSGEVLALELLGELLADRLAAAGGPRLVAGTEVHELPLTSLG